MGVGSASLLTDGDLSIHAPKNRVFTAAYADHPVRFGVVESIDTTIKAVLRRASTG